MKLASFYLGIIMVTVVSFTGGFSEEIPVTSDALAFIRIDLNPADPGLAWLYNHWLSAPRPSAIRNIVEKHSPSSAIAALYPESRESTIPYTVILTYPQVVDSSLGFTKTIEKILQQEDRNEGLFSKNIQSGIPLYFAYNTIEKSGVGFILSGKWIMIGNNYSILQKTIPIIQRKQSGLTAYPDFIQLQQQLTITPDILIYGNNATQQFARFLSLREKKWKIKLLLSAKDIRAVIIGLDAIDADKLKGIMVFKAANTKAIPDITDDASFLGEAFRRKFIAEKIKWTSKVTTAGDYVTLQFDITGLKPLWLDLFKTGGLSLVK
jgi:hypothetical protein